MKLKNAMKIHLDENIPDIHIYSNCSKKIVKILTSDINNDFIEFPLNSTIDTLESESEAKSNYSESFQKVNETPNSIEGSTQGEDSNQEEGLNQDIYCSIEKFREVSIDLEISNFINTRNFMIMKQIQLMRKWRQGLYSTNWILKR